MTGHPPKYFSASLYYNTLFDFLQVTKEYYTETVLSKQKELEKLEVSEPGKSFATLFGKKPEQVKEERIDKLKIEITSLSADGEVCIILFREKCKRNYHMSMLRYETLIEMAL